MVETCASVADGSIKYRSFGFSIESTLCKDSVHGCPSNLVEFIVGEEAVRETISDTGEKDGGIMGPGFMSFEGAAGDEFAFLIAFGF